MGMIEFDDHSEENQTTFLAYLNGRNPEARWRARPRCLVPAFLYGYADTSGWCLPQCVRVPVDDNSLASWAPTRCGQKEERVTVDSGNMSARHETGCFSMSSDGES